MPIRSCSDGDKPGYKWGDSGKCYLYTAGDEKSMEAAKMKAQMQGVAARANGYEEKANEVTTSSMGSGIKNPQRGYGSKKKKKFVDDIWIEIFNYLDINSEYPDEEKGPFAVNQERMLTRLKYVKKSNYNFNIYMNLMKGVKTTKSDFDIEGLLGNIMKGDD